MGNYKPIFVYMWISLKICSTSYSRNTNYILETFIPQITLRGVDWIFISEELPTFDENAEWILTNTCVMKNVTKDFVETIGISGKDTAIVISPKNAGSFLIELHEVSKAYKEMQLKSNSDKHWWKPKILIFWPEQEFNSSTNLEPPNIISSTIGKHNFINSFLVDSDIYVVFKNKMALSIWGIYTIHGILHFRQLNFGNARDLTFVLRKATRRGDFNGALIVGVGMMDPDYYRQCHEETLEDGSTKIVGLCQEIMEDMQAALNFTYKIIHGTGWIHPFPNGSLAGIGGQVEDGYADLSISHSLYLPYRQSQVNYLQPTEKAAAEIFFIQPNQTSLRDVYLSTFQMETWLSFALTWACIIVSILIFARVQSQLYDKALEDWEGDQDQRRANEVFLWSIATTSQQGWHCSPTSTPMRIATFFSLIFGLVIYIAFSASLVSNLSDRRPPISSLAELAESNFLIIGDPSIPYNITIGALPSDREGEMNWLSIETGIGLLLKSSSAYVTFPDGFLSVMDRMHISKDVFCNRIYRLMPTKGTYHSGMIIRKGSEYKELFNHRIVLMKEIGLNQRINERYNADTGGTCKKDSKRKIDIGLGIQDLFTAYVVLILGYCCSFIFLLLEITFKRMLQVPSKNYNVYM